MSNAFLAKNSTVKVATHLVGGLRTIALPTVTVEQIDVTSHDSTGNYKEFIGGLWDVSEISLSGLLIKGDVGQSYMRSHPGEVVQVEIGLPNGMKFEFEALIGQAGGELPYEGAATFTGTLKPTGVITITEAP